MAFAEGIFEVSRAGVGRSDHLALSRAPEADYIRDAEVRDRFDDALSPLIIKVTDKSVFVAGDYGSASKICSALYTDGPSRKAIPAAANDDAIGAMLLRDFAHAGRRHHLTQDFSLAARFVHAAQRGLGQHLRAA